MIEFIFKIHIGNQKVKMLCLVLLLYIVHMNTCLSTFYGYKQMPLHNIYTNTYTIRSPNVLINVESTANAIGQLH